MVKIFKSNPGSDGVLVMLEFTSLPYLFLVVADGEDASFQVGWYLGREDFRSVDIVYL